MINGELAGGWALPLWKIWVRQIGWLFPISGKIIQMFQTTNQNSINLHCCWINHHFPMFFQNHQAVWGKRWTSSPKTKCDVLAAAPQPVRHPVLLGPWKTKRRGVRTARARRICEAQKGEVRAWSQFLTPNGPMQLWPWLLIITGYKWDYTIYKWGFVSTYNWYFGP